MLTQSTALELAPYDIRVNAIAPGNTPYEECKEHGSASLQRNGTSMDQASAALYLASEESSWVTGQLLVVDGGQSLLSIIRES